MLWHLLVLGLFHTQCAGATTLAAWSQRAPPDVMPALQQRPRAGAPTGDSTSSAAPPSTDIDEWELVPPIGVGNTSRSNRNISQVPAALSGIPIEAAIKKRRDAGVQLCVTVGGYLRGGLSNSVGVVNIVMDYSIKQNLQFIMPQILPPSIGHDLGDDFANMFGSDPVCATRTVSVWPASCPSSSLLTEQLPESELPKFDGCSVSEQAVLDSYKDTTRLCGCDELLLVGTRNMTWSFDYSRTGPLFSERYWRHAPGAPSDSAALRFPLLTAMHVRLGDVENADYGGKFWTGDAYAQLAKALTSFIDAACFDVTILTDGGPGDENIYAPWKYWADQKVSSLRVLDIGTPATVSLNTMAMADVLIGGPSGFSRFAAVLGAAQVKLFIDNKNNGFSIEYLPGVSDIPLKVIDQGSSVYVAARQALSQNDQVAKIATACAKWLAAH